MLNGLPYSLALIASAIISMFFLGVKIFVKELFNESLITYFNDVKAFIIYFII